jgi:glycosyltransferase involved in cell wall biosynthesis
MVSILKEKKGNSKGVLVFTHKERYIFNKPIKPLQRAIKKLKKEYILGMHWGYHHKNQSPIPYIDFHLAGKGTVSFANNVTTPTYEYCSRNFIPKYFVPFDCPIHWDIVTVATPTKIKRMDELLEVIIRTLDRGVDLKALLLCPRPMKLTDRKWDHNFFSRYESDLSDSEKEKINLVTPIRTNDDIYPLPNQFIPYIYNSASAFTLFSEKEGESRVISEALLTGTKVITRNTLLGGGQDFLDQTNSELFASLDEAVDIFVDVNRNPGNYHFDPEYLRDSLWAPRTVPAFESVIEEIFEYYNQPFDGKLYTSNLDDKLPSHETSLPKKFRKSGTNDLKNQFAALKYIEYLCEQHISIGIKSVLRYKQHQISGIPSNIVNNIDHYSWKIDQKTPLETRDKLKSIYEKISK